MKVYIKYGEASDIVASLKDYCGSVDTEFKFGIDGKGLYLDPVNQEQEDLILLLFGNQTDANIL